jgi:general secretion pathway protein A
MYQQFFGLTDEPFPKDIKVSNLFISSSHKELFKRFEFIKEKRGIMVVYGEPGLGKTATMRYLIDSLNRNAFLPIYLPLATVGVNDFYRQLNNSIKGDPVYFKSKLFQAIQNQIINYAVHKGIIPVIILDEAHLLIDQNIKELQIITNFNCDTVDPAIFILCGQPLLMEHLKKNILNSFYQRIAIKYMLTPLSREEVTDYINHHLKLVKCEQDILTEGAYESVFKMSGGKVRIIGELVRMSMIICANEKRHKITDEDVMTAAQEVL